VTIQLPISSPHIEQARRAPNRSTRVESGHLPEEFVSDAELQLAFPACRTVNCDQDADCDDDFCARCHDEIAAVRDSARRRFVIFGTSAIGRRHR
jgi:hypothetical protein